MNWLDVLLEGASDAPVVREVLTRRFSLRDGLDFRIYPHLGRGRLPRDPLSPPDRKHRGLLDQLPAKLQGLAWKGAGSCVLVVLDVDGDRCVDLLAPLKTMLDRLPKRPTCVLFRLAIEETESWFLADRRAVSIAYPKVNQNRLRRIVPDSICGAWEQLAHALGVDPASVTGTAKATWAARIAPHLDLDDPGSPSLGKLIHGIEGMLRSRGGLDGNGV